MHPAALCLVPHPAGPSPSRAICARVLEEAVRQAPAAVNTLVVRLVGTQDAGVGGGSGSGDCGDAASGARIPEWRSRAEEIALYNEIHSLAMQHDRLTLDMVVMPFYAPESAETDGSKSAGTTLPQAFALSPPTADSVRKLVQKVHPSPPWIPTRLSRRFSTTKISSPTRMSRGISRLIISWPWVGRLTTFTLATNGFLLLPPGYARERSLLASLQTSISPKRRKSLAT